MELFAVFYSDGGCGTLRWLSTTAQGAHDYCASYPTRKESELSAQFGLLSIQIVGVDGPLDPQPDVYEPIAVYSVKGKDVTERVRSGEVWVWTEEE